MRARAEEQSLRCARFDQSFTQVELDNGVRSFERDELMLACCFMTEGI